MADKRIESVLRIGTSNIKSEFDKILKKLKFYTIY